MILNVNNPSVLKKHINLLSKDQITGRNFYESSEFTLDKRDGFVTSSNENLEAVVDTGLDTITLKYIGNNPGFSLNNRKIIGTILFDGENTGFLHKITNQYSVDNLTEILFQWDANTELNIANATGYQFSVGKILVVPESAEDMVCFKCARFKLVGNSLTTATISNISGDPLDVNTVELFASVAFQGYNSSRTVKEGGVEPTDLNIYWGNVNSSLIKDFTENQADLNTVQKYVKQFQKKGLNTVSLGWSFDSATDRTSSYFLCCGLKKRSDLEPADVEIFSIKFLISGGSNNIIEHGEIPVQEDEFLSSISIEQSEGSVAPTRVNTSSNTQNSKNYSSIVANSTAGLNSFLVSFDETGILCRENFFQTKQVTPFANNCAITFVSGMNIVDVIATTGIDMDTAFYMMGVKNIDSPNVPQGATNTRTILLSEARTSGSTMGFESHAPIVDDGTVTGIEFWAVDLLTISLQRANNVHYCSKFLKEHKCPYFLHKIKGGARIWNLIDLLNFQYNYKKTSENRIKIKDFYEMFVQENTNNDDKRRYTKLNAVYEDGCEILLKMQKSGVGFPELIQDETCDECKLKSTEGCEVCKGRVLKSENITIINSMIKDYIMVWELKKLIK